MFTASLNNSITCDMCAWKVYSDGVCVYVRLSVWLDSGIHTICAQWYQHTHKRKHKHKRTLNESFTVNDKTGYYLLEPKKGVYLGIPLAMGTILYVYYYYCYSRRMRNTLLLLILDWWAEAPINAWNSTWSTMMEPRKSTDAMEEGTHWDEASAGPNSMWSASHWRMR